MSLDHFTVCADDGDRHIWLEHDDLGVSGRSNVIVFFFKGVNTCSRIKNV
jgi:hypothetical protein